MTETELRCMTCLKTYDISHTEGLKCSFKCTCGDTDFLSLCPGYELEDE